MECSGIPAQVIASCFALVGFAAAILVGVASDNNSETVLWRAIVVMLLAWPIGRLCGYVAEQAVQSHIDAYKKKHPIASDEQVHGGPAGSEGQNGQATRSDGNGPGQSFTSRAAGQSSS